MSNILTNHPIWNYNIRTLPEPFSGLKKKVDKCSSIINASNIGQSTLVPGLIRAIHIFQEKSKKTFALGENEKWYFAEIEDPDKLEIQLVAYNKDNGMIKGAVFSKDTLSFQPLAVGKKISSPMCAKTFGECVFLSMFVEYTADVEVSNYMSEVSKCFDGTDITDSEHLNSCLGILCDNLYRRVTKFDKTDEGFLALDIPENGIAMSLNPASIRSKDMSPSIILKGSFQVFNTSSSSVHTLKHGDFFVKKDEELTDEEKERVCVMGKEHAVTSIEFELTEDIKNRWDLEGHRIKNIILEGPAGTGKGEVAKALSYNLNLPYATLICSENTSEDDIKGCILPVIDCDGDNTGNTAMNLEEELAKLPGSLEIQFDPVSTYEKLTGIKDESITEFEVLEEVNRRAIELAKTYKPSNPSEITYAFYKSEIVKALENGWLLEIQEPTCIRNPSVLSCLNDIMNSEAGVINTLLGPIYRHPDAIVIYTTNRYQTNVPLDPAVRDRCITIKMDLPSIDDMVKRCKAKSLLKDEPTIKKMAEAIQTLSAVAKSNGLQGECGMRSLFSWCDDVALGKPIEEAIKRNVLFKITTDDDELEILQGALNTIGMSVIF